ncbi:recombinase family protein [Bacillus paramycoides]|uniref:recombinase family protein n=1 Tax=Bacillus paramycoides TaxID=2026194 RepID=UPI002E1ED2AF|nr:recombinase family protein [Bacillus paramycoides]
MQHLIQIVNNLNAKEISFHSLQENITMDKNITTDSLCSICFAEFEHNLIRERSTAAANSSTRKRATW